ncbi:MAG TPA: hypothetical protein ENK82_06030, partial [Campylobacterales bacterium]|nr:hypothetical protein [Campylobacterales bacterium]
MFKKIVMGMSLSFLFLSAQQPVKGISLTKTVFEEKTIWDKIHGAVQKVVPATKVNKNAILIYVNQVTNYSNQTKKNIVIDNPIPKGTVYIPKSARCEGGCQIYYSIDGGKSFKKQEELFVIYGTAKRVPNGSEYSHIKFVFPQLIPYKKV